MYKLHITPKCEPTCAGERYRTDYVKAYDENGVPYLKESGKTDLQAYYDSQAASCDLSVIIQNMIAQGLNPFGSKVEYLDDLDDVVDLQGQTPADIMIAASNMKANVDLLKKYEAELAALNKKTDDLQQQLNNAKEATSNV